MSLFHLCRISIFLFFCVLPAQLEAQSLHLLGRVLDAETGAPLEGANVAGGAASASTGPNGQFALTIAPGDPITVSFVGYKTKTLYPQDSVLTVLLSPAVLQAPEIIVEGGLAEETLREAAASITVMDRNSLQRANGHHFQNLTSVVPNLNWSGGTSRPRYFQIRGMGENSHFVGEKPPNYLVGFVLDGVDLSGLGTAGVLFDLDRVEVFKGPQSTIFGPNAMAGLISLQSTDPLPFPSHGVTVSRGNDDLLHAAATVNVPLNEKLAIRAGYHEARSNGFRSNMFLDREDSNRRWENFARAKVSYTLDSGLQLLGTLFRANLNNGYDAWSHDNNEELITHSDNPGKDHQETTAFSFKGEAPLEGLGLDIVSITAYSETDLEYSFDGDWGNDEEYWRGEPYNLDPERDGWTNDFFDRTLRERSTFTQEVRLLKSTPGGNGKAIAGAYFKVLEESDDATSWVFGSSIPIDHNSTFEVDNLAFYGQYSRNLGDAVKLAFNLRLDRNSTSYQGATANEESVDRVNFDVAQWLSGGKLALTCRLAPGAAIYGAVSRGYRAGGVNQNPRLSDRDRPFGPEYATNLEMGLRSRGTSLTLFHTLRFDQQVSLSRQQNPDDPNSFSFFTDNASRGRSSGVELEQSYRPLPGVHLFGSLGYLKTYVDPYTFETDKGLETRGDRAAAHAPEYTFSVGGEYGHRSGLGGRWEIVGMDRFFFSDSHDQTSEPYRLVNGHVSYHWDTWSMQLWGRNLLDQRYAVRGFFFRLEPPNYDKKLYKSYGDPRQVGVQLTTRFSSLGN